MIIFVLFASVIVGLTFGVEAVGKFFLRLIGFPTDRSETILSWSIGISALTLLLSLLAAAQGFSPLTMQVLLIVVALIGLVRVIYLFVFEQVYIKPVLPEIGFNPIALRIFTTVMLIVCFATVLSPETRHDPYDYHLTIPSIYLAQGGAIEIPWHVFTYMPKNGEMLFGFALGLGTDELAKLIHYLFGCAILLLIHTFLRRICGHEAGLFGVFWVVSLPLFGFLATSAYVDLLRTFWEMMALYLLYRAWIETSRANLLRWSFLSAWMAGMAMGTKYVAWGVFFPPYFLLLTLVLWKKGLFRAHWLLGIAACLTAPVATWLSLNWLWTGNPVYPLLPQIFGMNIPAAYDAYEFFRGHAPPPGTFQGMQALGYIGQRIHFLLIEGNALALLGAAALLATPWFLRRGDKGVDLPSSVYAGSVLFIVVSVFLFIVLTDNHDGRFFFSVMALLAIPVALFMDRVQAMMRESSSLGPYFVPAVILIVFLNALTFRYNQLNDQGETILPILGAEQREQFLTRRFDHHPLIVWANNNLPDDAYVIGMGYPLRHRHIARVKHGYVPFLDDLDSPSPQELAERLHAEGVTHVVSPFIRLREGIDLSILSPEWLHPVYQHRSYVIHVLKENAYPL